MTQIVYRGEQASKHRKWKEKERHIKYKWKHPVKANSLVRVKYMTDNYEGELQNVNKRKIRYRVV